MQNEPKVKFFFSEVLKLGKNDVGQMQRFLKTAVTTQKMKLLNIIELSIHFLSKLNAANQKL